MGDVFRIWLIFLLFVVQLNGQDTIDQVVVLDVFELRTSKLVDFSVLSDVAKDDHQLDAVLGKEGFGFIKNYGAGQISSISVHGTGARHTKLYWDDVPLNSPMLGELDLSLLPVFYFEQIEFMDHSKRLELGEGAFGTSVNLRTPNELKDEIIVRQHLSSLMNARTELTVSTSYKQFASRTQVFGDVGKNRFQYKDELSPGKPKRFSEHTDYQQAGVMQQFRMKLSKDQGLSLSGWYQYSDRDFQFPKGNQKDSNFRSKLEYYKKWKENAGQTKFKAAWLKETFNYKELKSEAEKLFLLAKHEHLLLGTSRIGFRLSWEEDHAIAEGYPGGVRQRKGIVGASFSKSFTKGYQIKATVRELMVDGLLSPLLFSLSTNYKNMDDPLSVKLSLSRDYNYPTINSRFWSPGGNPNLKPEHSYDAMIGIQSFYEKKERWKNMVAIEGYFKYINDWIQWTPSETSSFWEVKNFRTVNSAGIDLRANTTFYVRKHALSIDGVYSFVSSKVVASDLDYDKAIGNQLIYTPSFQYKGSLSWNYSNWNVQYLQEYTHTRYVTEDNNVSLPGYQVGNLSIGYKTMWKATNLDIQFTINNIWNTDYRIVSGRPMPLRNYQLTLSTKLPLKKKQHYDNQPNK